MTKASTVGNTVCTDSSVPALSAAETVSIISLAIQASSGVTKAATTVATSTPMVSLGPDSSVIPSARA